MYYFYNLTSVLASIGEGGQRRVTWRLPVGLRFGRKLKKPFGCHPEQSAVFALRMSLRSEGSAFLPNRKENAYSLEARLS
jgi:hypothetical protein